MASALGDVSAVEQLVAVGIHLVGRLVDAHLWRDDVQGDEVWDRQENRNNWKKKAG